MPFLLGMMGGVVGGGSEAIAVLLIEEVVILEWEMGGMFGYFEVHEFLLEGDDLLQGVPRSRP